jgi:hypothetical protein
MFGIHSRRPRPTVVRLTSYVTVFDAGFGLGPAPIDVLSTTASGAFNALTSYATVFEVMD